MTMLEYQENYGTEDQCKQYLYEKRWPKGFVCPKCSHTECFNIQSRNLYQCKACNRQTSITAGTIMDKTRTPLRKWFLALYLVGEDKRGISALALMKKIGVSYNTAWTMLSKIRHAMAERENTYMLGGIIEMDEAFFGAPTEGGKRGRGTDKTAVLVSVCLTDEGKPGFAKMEVIEHVDSKAVTDFANGSITKGSEIHTDGLKIYRPLAQEGYSLIQKKYDAKGNPEHLHWTHIIVSNAKAFINGTFHGLGSTHLQRYLDEFCYRFNRRWLVSGIFPKLVDAVARSSIIRNYELVR